MDGRKEGKIVRLGWKRGKDGHIGWIRRSITAGWGNEQQRGRRVRVTNVQCYQPEPMNAGVDVRWTRPVYHLTLKSSALMQCTLLPCTLNPKCVPVSSSGACIIASRSATQTFILCLFMYNELADYLRPCPSIILNTLYPLGIVVVQTVTMFTWWLAPRDILFKLDKTMG